MKAHRLFRYLPLLLVTAVAADVFELKDGTKLEGTILREDGDDYIIEVQVTKSIRDERRVAKSDVVNQVAEKKDEKAFEEIANLVPAPDLLSDEEYGKRSRKIEAFLKEFPKSPKNLGARKLLDALEAERSAIAAGGVKFDGKIISAKDRAPKAYALDARIAASQIEAAATAGDYLTALRHWTKFEENFRGSSAYRETIPLIVQVMNSHLATVSSALSGFDARVKAREADLAGMGVNERNRSQQAIDEVKRTYDARIEQEKAAGIKWPTLDPYEKRPLEDTKRMLESEIRRLESLDTSNLPKTEEAYEEAWNAITKEGATKQEIDSALSKARSSSMPPSYLELLQEAAPKTPAP